jgi:hypothetical protein
VKLDGKFESIQHEPVVKRGDIVEVGRRGKLSESLAQIWVVEGDIE